MSQPPPSPRQPLVVVLGSTGTGKSDLAVELALKFDGEIINADAMQMYRGLPVTTNKISVEEQCGVPHHLLGTIELNEPTWHVSRFRREASRIISEIHGRDRLPIVVGGSQYYTDGLLFDDHLVDDAERIEGEKELDRDDGIGETDDNDRYERFPILNASTEAMLVELRLVDPVMADRWHPNDRRKIQRSLEIFLKTGRRASDIYADQQKRREERVRERSAPKEGVVSAAGPPRPWQYLLLWLYAKPDVLNTRLDARIDTMLDRGLEQETGGMFDTLRDFDARGVPIDRSKGIWQSIGYKEMEPFEVARRASNSGAKEGAAVEGAAAIAKLREAGLDAIKFGTRRYARYQLRWIKHKTIPYLVDAHALDRLFLLDSTDRAQWTNNVAERGVRLTAAFLGRSDTPAEGLPRPVDVSETAREVLTATVAASRGSNTEAGKPVYRQDCVICRATLLSEDQWNKHIRGTRHRRVLQKHKRRSLVPVQAEIVQPQTTCRNVAEPAQESSISAKQSTPPQDGDSPVILGEEDA